jgi:hypothetical protein
MPPLELSTRQAPRREIVGRKAAEPSSKIVIAPSFHLRICNYPYGSCFSADAIRHNFHESQIKMCPLMKSPDENQTKRLLHAQRDILPRHFSEQIALTSAADSPSASIETRSIVSMRNNKLGGRSRGD